MDHTVSLTSAVPQASDIAFVADALRISYKAAAAVLNNPRFSVQAERHVEEYCDFSSGIVQNGLSKYRPTVTINVEVGSPSLSGTRHIRSVDITESVVSLIRALEQ